MYINPAKIQKDKIKFECESCGDSYAEIEDLELGIWQLVSIRDPHRSWEKHHTATQFKRWSCSSCHAPHTINNGEVVIDRT